MVSLDSALEAAAEEAWQEERANRTRRGVGFGPRIAELEAMEAQHGELSERLQAELSSLREKEATVAELFKEGALRELLAREATQRKQEAFEEEYEAQQARFAEEEKEEWWRFYLRAGGTREMFIAEYPHLNSVVGRRAQRIREGARLRVL